MASHDDDDDDPVVAEYKVFVSQALGGRLHLFQYPLRNADRHYELSSRTLTVTKGVGESANPNKLQQAMASPASLPGPTSRFEMKMRLDISSSDSFKGRRRGGPGGGGGAGNGGMDSPMNSMDLLEGRAANADSGEEDPGVYKYTLESQPATLQSSYAAALFMRDEVHITPINTVQQFGPKITAEQTDDSFLSSLRADVSTSSAMMNHLERQLHRLRSVVLEEDAKTAMPVDFFESYSVESATVARQFPFTGKATDPMSSSLGMAMDPKGRPPFKPLPDALSHYFPIESCGSRDESFRQSRPTVLRYAHLTHTINDQVKALLQSAVLLTVAQVTEVVRCIDGPQPRTDRRGYETQIVAALKRYAVLVHGTWAATYDTAFRGAQAFLRENVLLTFATSTRGAVTFAEAAAPVRGHVFHERTVRAILESIASLDKSTKQWVLRGSAEGTAWMQDNFPDEVEFQRQQWARRSPDILRNIDSLLSGRLPPKQHLRLPIQPPVAGVTPNRSQSAPAPLLSLKPEPTAATAMDDVEARATAIRFLRLTVQQVGVVSSELMREHIRASIQKPSCILNRCSLPVVQEAAKDTLQTFTKGTWILKSVDAATDAYRASLIHAMRQKPSFTSKEIVADAEEILNRDSPAERRALPTTVVSAVLDELTEYHSGERLYHVKTGRVTFSPPAPGTMV